MMQQLRTHVRRIITGLYSGDLLSDVHVSQAADHWADAAEGFVAEGVLEEDELLDCNTVLELMLFLEVGVENTLDSLTPADRAQSLAAIGDRVPGGIDAVIDAAGVGVLSAGLASGGEVGSGADPLGWLENPA